MEKAHGWEYKRSKGKGKRKGATDTSLSHGPHGLKDGNPLALQNEIRDFNPNNVELHDDFPYGPYCDPLDDLAFPAYDVTADYDAFPDINKDRVFGHQDNPQDSNPNLDFHLFDHEDLYSAVAQLPTPSYETPNTPWDVNTPTGHAFAAGHGNTLLYTPTPLQDIDEGFEDFAPNSPKDTNTGSDFQLFPLSIGGIIASSAPSALLPDFPSTPNE
jgi:hypothetical protein